MAEEMRALEVSFVPATISADFDMLEARVDAMLETYDGWVPNAADAQEMADAKRERAWLNSQSKELNARRIAVKKEYMRPLEQFEARVKQITGKIDAVSDRIGACVKAAEDAEKAAKRQQIQDAYEDFAPMICGVLPFARFWDLSLARGRKWDNKSPRADKCVEEMREDVQRIASDLEAVREIRTGHPDVAEREFWRTLDLSQARRAAKAADDEDERIAELRAQQEEQRRAAEAARKAAEEARAAEEERMRAGRIADDGAAKEAGGFTEKRIEYEKPRIIEKPQGMRLPCVSAAEKAAQPEQAPRREERGPWVLSIGNATEAQAQRILQFVQAFPGVAAQLLKGDLYDVAWGQA